MELEKLRKVLNRIWSGEFRHQQSSYVYKTECGTARCIAGWVYYLEHGCDDMSFGTRPWNEAKKILGITEGEARLLFSTECTKQLHEMVLKAFQEGRRFITEEHRTYIVNEKEDDGYVSTSWYISACDPEGVAKFLGLEKTDKRIKVLVA